MFAPGLIAMALTLVLVLAATLFDHWRSDRRGLRDY
jgi:hypothetical protein